MLFRFRRRLCVAPLILILAFSIYCAAEDEPSSGVYALPEFSDPLGSGWAFADLDGDGETDRLVSREVGQNENGYLYRVDLKLSQSKGSGSFVVESTDALGVNIAVVDVDGDHDLDLVISDSFSLQRIGVWINDGKGSFTQNLHTLYSPPTDLLLQSLRLDIPTQAINQKSSRRFHAHVSHGGFVQAVPFCKWTTCGIAIDHKIRLPNGPFRLRAPPIVS